MQFRILINGILLLKQLNLFKFAPTFLREYNQFRKQAQNGHNDFPLKQFYPCFEDRFQESGVASGHYFHQDLLVASKIFKNNPHKHVDIGSRVDGFVAHVASFREIEFINIRQIRTQIDNIIFTQGNLMENNFILEDYCDSISCLHALEHFGLGRYGDKIDYQGHLLGWENIYKILKKGGKLYFSVPIGKQCVEFNAHRIFSMAYILKMIGGLYHINSFSYVNDAGDLIKNPEITEDAIKSNFSCNYGCGIFELIKI